MRYKITDQLHTFDFNEGIIADIENSLNHFTIIIDNVTIKADNPFNRDIIDMRTNHLRLTFYNANIEQITEEGFKVYDADGNLQQTVPDCIIEKEKYQEIFERLINCTIFSIQKDNNHYRVHIDSEYHTFSIQLQAEQSIAEWDKFMKKEG